MQKPSTPHRMTAAGLSGRALFLAAAITLAGCASNAPVNPPPSASVPKSAPAAAPASDAAPAKAAPAATTTTSAGSSTKAPPTTMAALSDASSAQVCRRVEVLGSRVRKTRICKTKGEWDQIEQQKDETFRRIDRGASGAGPDPALGGG
jgi:hypothetical protein